MDLCCCGATVRNDEEGIIDYMCGMREVDGEFDDTHATDHFKALLATAERKMLALYAVVRAVNNYCHADGSYTNVLDALKTVEMQVEGE